MENNPSHCQRLMVFGRDMDSKSKERGILKLDPRQRSGADAKSELTPQASYERPPSSPQPSVDRLSVTWADPGSMASSGVNLFHLPSETAPNTEVKFSPSTGDGSEDEDYSASLSAVLRQRRASVRRSRKGRARRPSSPFLPDETRSRRRSSVFTTSSGDTAISIDDQPVVTQQQIFENIHLHKEVLGSVKQQPLGMRRKLKIVHQAKGYIKRHEGQLQERLAQSKSTKDIYARFNILFATKWQQLKREAANTSNLLIPWELRIKEIESHFGSVVASYFTFLRWLFWVNLVIGFILLVFVIIPECLTANPTQDGERKIIMEEERQNSTNLLTLWEFEGALKYSPIFYGYYSNVERAEYRMPLAYFLTGLIVYIYSFVAILRKMAENSRMSKLSEKEDECIFSWKLFTGWDYMIGNAETAHNRIASVILGFKEALLEEAEKKRNLRNWRTISLRAVVNICVVILLVVSAYAVVTVVSRSDDNPKIRSWWRENETTIVVTVISITFPLFFELLGLLEDYHPRKQLRLQLARIMLLNLLNLYSLIFAMFSKIEGMSRELVSLQPTLHMNVTIIPIMNMSEPLDATLPLTCFEIRVPCSPCDAAVYKQVSDLSSLINNFENINNQNFIARNDDNKGSSSLRRRNLRNIANVILEVNIDSKDDEKALLNEIERIRNLSMISASEDSNDESSEIGDPDFYDNYDTLSSIDTNLSLTSTETYKDYRYTFQSTDVPILATTQNSDETESSTLSSYFEITTLKDSNLSEFISSTETTYYSTEDTSSKNFDITSSTGITEYSTKADTTYTNTDFTTTTELKYLSTNYTNLFIDTSSTVDDVDLFTTTDSSSTSEEVIKCADISFNCSINCGNKNITKIFYVSKCKIIDIKCYITQCSPLKDNLEDMKSNGTNSSIVDVAYMDVNNRKMYNLSKETKKKLLKLCWETMFGQELIKLTMMDLVFVVLGTLFTDFFRALFVRYMNKCWCWDLEKKFPEYGDFKIAENILHLINNQGMVWMGMFFSPGLVVLNVFKLMIMMYLRSWAVITCNVPHEVVFRVSKSNNFYLALLLTMLFLCVLPVGYTIVWVTPSWHCGPFSEYDKIYKILTSNVYKILPKSLNFALQYITSPAIVIPLLVLLILIIYYLTSLTNSLREANNDLKIQLRRERTEERRKMFQLADTRRRGGSSSIENTPFARWKKALPSLPLTKSIDSDDRKSVMDDKESKKSIKKKSGIFARIVGLALDKKCNEETSNVNLEKQSIDEETDNSFHETLPREILKMRDITIAKNSELKKKNSVEFKTIANFDVHSEHVTGDDFKEKDSAIYRLEENKNEDIKFKVNNTKEKVTNECIPQNKHDSSENFKQKQQSSESSNLSKNNDSIGSVIPVITISTTESDDEVLQGAKNCKASINTGSEKERRREKPIGSKSSVQKQRGNLKRNKNCPDLKLLQRQGSVDSINEKNSKEKKVEDTGYKYQYSL